MSVSIESAAPVDRMWWLLATVPKWNYPFLHLRLSRSWLGNTPVLVVSFWKFAAKVSCWPQSSAWGWMQQIFWLYCVKSVQDAWKVHASFAVRCFRLLFHEKAWICTEGPEYPNTRRMVLDQKSRGSHTRGFPNQKSRASPNQKSRGLPHGSNKIPSQKSRLDSSSLVSSGLESRVRRSEQSQGNPGFVFESGCVKKKTANEGEQCTEG